MNKKIKFKNISNLIELGSEPAWQKEIVKRVEKEYYEQALFVAEQFKKAVLSLNVKQGYFGSAVLEIMENIHKLEYIKNINAYDEMYEAEIDLLAHTVSFWSVDEEVQS